MLAAMRSLAQHFETADTPDIDKCLDDYCVWFTVDRGTKEKPDLLDVRWAIWDAGECETGVSDVEGNFVIDIVEHGGRIVGNFSPYNYTDKCWCDYDDDTEWNSRLSMCEEALANQATIQAIQEWLEEGK